MRLPFVLAAPAVAAVLLMSALPASARLLIDIDKSTQTMTVSRDGTVLHRWPVSTGIPRYATPSGSFKPFRMEKDHFSREWDNAPMPHSIFFTMKGHAIHGTNHKNIGRPASHGCVRLEPENARVLFDMVKHERMANTQVVLHGETPSANAPAVARTPRYEQQPRYRTQPGYVAREDDGAYGRRRAERDFDEPPYRGDVSDGYWVLYPDGTRVFVSRQNRQLPLPFFFGGPFGGR